MNPTHDIPHGTAPASHDQPTPAISATSPEKTAQPKSAPEGIPADLTNLALAAGLLLSAFLLFWMGSYLSNHVALRTLIASFGTFALVWVLYRLRVFHRPHGGLIAAGSVALFAAALPFVERGFQKLDHAAKAGLAGEPAKTEGDMTSQLPVPTRQTIPDPPVPTAPPQEEEIVRELQAPPVDASAGRLIRLTQDAKVSINGKKFLIRAGSEFPLTEFKDGTVTFQAGNQEVTIDSDFVKFTGKSKDDTPEAIMKLAQAEAMRRYPAIGVKDSDENQLYLARVADLKSEMPDLMKNPRWPLVVAEELAAKEGWKSADQPADDTEPPSPLPGEEMKNLRKPLPSDPSDPDALPTPPNIPQEAPPALPPLPPAK